MNRRDFLKGLIAAAAATQVKLPEKSVIAVPPPPAKNPNAKVVSGLEEALTLAMLLDIQFEEDLSYLMEVDRMLNVTAPKIKDGEKLARDKHDDNLRMIFRNEHPDYIIDYGIQHR